MGETSIEWTQETWNPVRGCSRVSEGCRHCYAERMAARFSDPGMYAHGFAERTPAGGRWTGKVELIPEKLAEPLSWRKPRKVFVNSMSDLFHEGLSNEDIAAVFGVMAATPHITYQILTKRANRLAALAPEADLGDCLGRAADVLASIGWMPIAAGESETEHAERIYDALSKRCTAGDFPLSNVWFGVSVENQQVADERIPHLLNTPAAIRFLSVEPLLGPVDLHFPGVLKRTKPEGFDSWSSERQEEAIATAARAEYIARTETVDWVIVGGESGPGARSLDLAWIRSIVNQCCGAGVTVFVKQTGPRPFETVEAFEQLGTGGALERLEDLAETPAPRGWTRVHTPDGKSRLHRYLRMADKKGGDMSEWPEDLRVREMPEVAHG